MTDSAKVVFDEIQTLIEMRKEATKEQIKKLAKSLIDFEAIRYIKEEQSNRINHWQSQSNLHPIPRSNNFQKSKWLRIRSNPKLR